MATNTNQKLAVLIDADNAQASVIQELLAEVFRYGTANIKRAYGKWTFCICGASLQPRLKRDRQAIKLLPGNWWSFFV
jgi:hypothetical protein